MPDRMYDFSDRHLEFLTEYFAVAGIKLCQDTELGIIYLEEQTESVRNCRNLRPFICCC